MTRRTGRGILSAVPRALRPTALVAAALLAAACAKDLELPSRSTTPVVASLTPARAHAGQLVRVQGSGLDPDPAANVVGFAAATTRGLRYDGAALVVRVPPDAGSGPVIVTNGDGTSEPSREAFGYLGLGEPRRRSPTAGLPILHAPTAVHGVGGTVFVDSTIYDGLLSSADPSFTTPPARLSAAADWNGALFTAADVAGRTATLWRVDAATGARTGPQAIPFVPTALVPLRSVDLLVAFAASGSQVAAWDLGTLSPVLAATTVAGVDEYFAAADVRDGRAVAAAYTSSSDVTLALLDFRGVRAGGVPVATALPGAFDPALDLRVAVAVADRAGAGVAAGEPLAAVALSGGDLGVARLGVAPAFVGTVETFSPSPIAALAGAATVPVVLATKPDDGLLVGVDLVARRLVWSVAANAPGAASASADLALVADRGDNVVSVVDLVDGSKVASVGLDVVPERGSAGSFAGGLAYLPRDPASDAEELLFLVSRRFPALLRFAVESRAASCVLRAPGLGPLAASPAQPAIWVARAGSPADVALLRDRGAAAPSVTVLPGSGRVSHLAPSGDGALALAVQAAIDAGMVGAGGGLASLDPRGAVSAVETGAFALVDLGVAPDGRIWALPAIGSETVAQLWSRASVRPGGAPDATHRFSRMSEALSAAWLEDGLWVLGRGDAPVAALLGPDLAVARTVALAGDAPAGAIASPNGRLLVERVVGGPAGQTVLRFYRADPEVGFPLVDTLVLDGVVEGLTFDATGERLWVVTRAPDRIVLVD